MSGNFPLNPKPSSVGIKSTTPTITSMAQSGRRYVRRVGSQYWMIDVQFDLMRRVDFMPINAFIESQGGNFGTFDFFSHDNSIPQGDAVGRTPAVDVGSQTGTSITTVGWGANNVTVLKAGDIIRFANHTKVYKITADVSTSATDTTSGVTTINFTPALIQSPLAAELITVSNVPYRVHLEGQDTSYTMSGVDLYTFSLSLRESL